MTGTDGFTCRVLIGRNNTLPFLYTYHPLQRGGYGDHINTGVKIERGRWYCIELGLRVNTVLEATPELLAQKPELNKHSARPIRGSRGRLGAMLGGREAAGKNSWRSVFATFPDLQIRRCLAFPYFGGAGERNTSPKDQAFYVDEVAISRSYVGPIDPSTADGAR